MCTKHKKLLFLGKYIKYNERIYIFCTCFKIFNDFLMHIMQNGNNLRNLLCIVLPRAFAYLCYKSSNDTWSLQNAALLDVAKPALTNSLESWTGTVLEQLEVITHDHANGTLLTASVLPLAQGGHSKGPGLLYVTWWAITRWEFHIVYHTESQLSGPFGIPSPCFVFCAVVPFSDLIMLPEK